MAKKPQLPVAVIWFGLLAFLSLQGHAIAEELYLPPDEGAWATVSPADLNWDSTALDPALRCAHGEKSSALDWHVHVVPSLKLAVVRLGEEPGAGFDAEIGSRPSEALGK